MKEMEKARSEYEEKMKLLRPQMILAIISFALVIFALIKILEAEGSLVEIGKKVKRIETSFKEGYNDTIKNKP